MDTFIIPLLMATPQAAADGTVSGGSLIGSFLPLVAIIAIFYFLIIRPQSKKRKETEKMHSGLKKGDKIVTIGGIYGTIQGVRETTVIVKVDENVRLEFLRSAISSVVTPSASRDDRIEDKSDEKEKSEE